MTMRSEDEYGPKQPRYSRKELLEMGVAALFTVGPLAAYVGFTQYERRNRLNNPEPRQQVETLTQDNLADVIRTSQDVPVFINYFTTWCHPCNTFNTVYAGMASEFPPDKMKFFEYNPEEPVDFEGTVLKDPRLVHSVPTVVILNKGQIVSIFDGTELAEGKYDNIPPDIAREIREHKRKHNFTDQDLARWKWHVVRQLEDKL